MNFDTFTNYEEFELPSKGLIYSKPINPEVSLRSMTTLEEMKRQSPTETPYKLMCDIIEDCMIKKPEISVYDMCIGDYLFLLHKLRIITYGPEYKLAVRCPNCGEISDQVINLDELGVIEYTDDIQSLKTLKLPQSGLTITLNYQTPRMLDRIEKRNKEDKRRAKENYVDLRLVYTIANLINTVDGNIIDMNEKEALARKLPMRDVNLLISQAEKINRKVGIDTSIVCDCAECGYKIATYFRNTSEFFRPHLD